MPRITPQAKTGILLDRFRLSKRLVILFTLVILVASVYGLFFSGLFDIKNVDVAGSQVIPKEVLAAWVKDYLTTDKVYHFLPADNLLLLQKDGLEKYLKNKTPRFTAILEIDKSFPSSLLIKIQERNGALIYINAAGENYLLAKDGVVLEKVPASFAGSTDQPLLVLKVSDGGSFDSGEVVQFKKSVEYALQLSSLWKEKISSSLMDSEMPSASSNDLYLRSVEGWAAYFDLGGAVEKQIQSLGLILNSEIPTDKRQQLAYIDLRIPEIVYYCYFNEPCSALGEQGAGDIEIVD